MVGDSLMDMQVGKTLNMHCIGVLTGDHNKEALEQAGANKVLNSFFLLPSFSSPLSLFPVVSLV